MNHKGTSASIIKAAEILFAEQGFAETTVRQITSKADVNLAAINYHFGSKKGLIQAVAEKFLTPLCTELTSMLEQRQSSTDAGQVTLDELLEILMRTLLVVNRDNVNALAVFMRLLELSYMQNQEELREFLVARYQDTLQPFILLLREDAAPMEDDEFFWRLHFLLGSITFTLSNFQTLHTIEKREYQRGAEVEKILHRMIPVLSAGLQARADKTYFCRV
ncbi:TetR/AcrR family transcriptional regulator [Neptuniibacter pectenicola]|jgi:AcrR family transcriptional regulator|uniref:TetR/AcrR family transcriptional regulator n=1 Tax=Neptuniibacter pectenicola TaxID=1806669 RepID=A0ABU9TSQ8_9GAMM|nr:TetR/AcrR family transcriptional regulator [Neptuniibacter pectenicola]KXJ57717.1 MAG: transcriptional regulator [Neptuniibacter sp. Phe_28]|tara:strand:- start:915 stop:1574 length:660 start_codon:yes stop_codon:yes gene_type:complete